MKNIITTKHRVLQTAAGIPSLFRDSKLPTIINRHNWVKQTFNQAPRAAVAARLDGSSLVSSAPASCRVAVLQDDSTPAAEQSRCQEPLQFRKFILHLSDRRLGSLASCGGRDRRIKVSLEKEPGRALLSGLTPGCFAQLARTARCALPLLPSGWKRREGMQEKGRGGREAMLQVGAERAAGKPGGFRAGREAG